MDCTTTCALASSSPTLLVTTQFILATVALPPLFTLSFDIRGTAPSADGGLVSIMSLVKHGVGAFLNLDLNVAGRLVLTGQLLSATGPVLSSDASEWQTVTITCTGTELRVSTSPDGSGGTTLQLNYALLSNAIEGMSLYFSSVGASAGGYIRNVHITGDGTPVYIRRLRLI